MMSSQKSLNFFVILSPWVIHRGHPIEMNKYTIILTFRRNKARISLNCQGGSVCMAQYYAVRLQKRNFPHYPQSYPQKWRLKPLFYMGFSDCPWIT